MVRGLDLGIEGERWEEEEIVRRGGGGQKRAVTLEIRNVTRGA